MVSVPLHSCSLSIPSAFVSPFHGSSYPSLPVPFSFSCSLSSSSSSSESWLSSVLLSCRPLSDSLSIPVSVTGVFSICFVGAFVAGVFILGSSLPGLVSRIPFPSDTSVNMFQILFISISFCTSILFSISTSLFPISSIISFIIFCITPALDSSFIPFSASATTVFPPALAFVSWSLPSAIPAPPSLLATPAGSTTFFPASFSSTVNTLRNVRLKREPLLALSFRIACYTNICVSPPIDNTSLSFSSNPLHALLSPFHLKTISGLPKTDAHNLYRRNHVRLLVCMIAKCVVPVPVVINDHQVAVDVESPVNLLPEFPHCPRPWPCFVRFSSICVLRPVIPFMYNSPPPLYAPLQFPVFL